MLSHSIIIISIYNDYGVSYIMLHFNKDVNSFLFFSSPFPWICRGANSLQKLWKTSSSAPIGGTGKGFSCQGAMCFSVYYNKCLTRILQCTFHIINKCLTRIILCNVNKIDIPSNKTRRKCYNVGTIQKTVILWPIFQKKQSKIKLHTIKKIIVWSDASGRVPSLMLSGTTASDREKAFPPCYLILCGKRLKRITKTPKRKNSLTKTRRIDNFSGFRCILDNSKPQNPWQVAQKSTFRRFLLHFPRFRRDFLWPGSHTKSVGFGLVKCPEQAACGDPRVQNSGPAVIRAQKSPGRGCWTGGFGCSRRVYVTRHGRFQAGCRERTVRCERERGKKRKSGVWFALCSSYICVYYIYINRAQPAFCTILYHAVPHCPKRRTQRWRCSCARLGRDS